MDLVAGIRKEGSRGGRGDFKWTEVEASQHRENYLGHSVMAPVGRWQQGRDLQWYTRELGDHEIQDDTRSALVDRQNELKRIQQAEQEVMNNMLGFQASPVFASESTSGTGANNVPMKGEAFGRKRLDGDLGEKSEPCKGRYSPRRQKQSNRMIRRRDDFHHDGTYRRSHSTRLRTRSRSPDRKTWEKSRSRKPRSSSRDHGKGASQDRPRRRRSRHDDIRRDQVYR